MEGKDENGMILPFRQDAAFFCRCAERYLDEEDLLRAAQYARKAYELEPDNFEYAITHAEALNRMRRYEESVQVLLLLRPFDELPEEALFGLASDFMGLEEFAAAKQCAELCLNTACDQEYIERAAELLDLLDDKDELEYSIGLEEGEDCKLLEGIRVAKTLQLSGRTGEAIEMLRSMQQQYPASDILDMDLAMLLFSVKANQEAEAVLFGVLKRNSRHIRAHLLMALLYRAEGKQREAREQLDRVIMDPDASPEELGYAGTVFIEFDQIDRAVDSLERLEEFIPYDKEMLYQLGYCYLKQGDRQKAEETYHTLKLSDESDTVASYYENAIRTEPAESFLKSWTLNYEVPTAEYLARRDRLQTVAQAGDDAIRQVWKNDPSFRALIEWALFSVIVPFRKVIVHMLTVIRDAEAERLLRRFLMSYMHGDEEKQFAFGALLSMEAEPPFALNMGGSWQYGAVAPMTVPDRLPRSYSYILWNIQQAKLRAREVDPAQEALVSDHLLDVAMRIYILYTNSFAGRYPKLTPAQEEAFSAAFLLLAVGSVENAEITPEMVCAWYHVSSRRLENALKRIFRQLKEDS
ncbi:MAG: tetratricopeptide repeat protein [Clostridia bacterium]|nr:tetratricopeptide repeat protein [Clostridia bacterium]